MQNDSLHIIEQLQPLHQPDQVAFWPPAPGWYVVAVLIFGLVLFGLLKWYRRWQQLQYRRLATATLSSWKNTSEELPVHKLNDLLKRVALISFPREQVAALYGQDWLDFLAQTGRSTDFSGAVGRLLIKGNYSRESARVSGTEKEDLLNLAMNWVDKHRTP